MSSKKSLKKSLTLSLVIPVYNEENHLKACLEAVATQTVQPDEVIIVDNNSTDGTAQICSQFPFVTVISEPQQGIVFARNAGFNKAKGDIIGRIDADTLLPPEWVSNVKLLASEIEPNDAVTGPCTFPHAPLSGVAFWFHRIIYFWTSRLLFGHNILFGSNMFFFRRMWLQVRKDVCLTNNVHEDMDLSHHIASNGGKIHFRKDFVAGISPRRFTKWGRYPVMWVYSRLIHLLPRSSR